jgi:hypothetical protein
MPEMRRGILRRGWLPYIGISLLIFILYAKCLGFSFTYLDDNVLVLENYPFLSRITNILGAFSQDLFGSVQTPDVYWRPLVTISLMLDAQVSGKQPFFYHLTNIFLHIIGSLLVFHLFKRLGYCGLASLVMGLVFAVHPLFVSAVAWIPGRNDTLMAIFSLGSFLWYLNFLETRRIKALVLHLVFFGLALLSKENALLLMVVIIFHSIFLAGKRDFLRDKSLLFGSWFLVVGSWFILRHFGLKSPLPIDFFALIGSLLKANWAVLQMVGKVLFPFNLAVMPTIEDTTLVYGFMAVGVFLFLLGFSKERRGGHIFFGVVWFLAFLLPSFMRPDRLVVGYFLEHRAYLAVVGLLIILLEVDYIKHINFHRRLERVFFSLLIFFLCYKTFVYAENFRDRLNFYESAVRSSPSLPLAHRNLCAIYYLEGRLKEAEEECKEALRINPYEPMANNNLGLIFMKRAQFREAEEAFLRELSFNPNYDDAHFNLGLLYYRWGRIEEAKKLWRKTLEINPEHKQALECLKISTDTNFSR